MSTLLFLILMFCLLWSIVWICSWLQRIACANERTALAQERIAKMMEGGEPK